MIFVRPNWLDVHQIYPQTRVTVRASTRSYSACVPTNFTNATCRRKSKASTKRSLPPATSNLTRSRLRTLAFGAAFGVHGFLCPERQRSALPASSRPTAIERGRASCCRPQRVNGGRSIVTDRKLHTSTWHVPSNGKASARSPTGLCQFALRRASVAEKRATTMPLSADRVTPAQFLSDTGRKGAGPPADRPENSDELLRILQTPSALKRAC
jgi:hypothetical protein